jgi:rare lipoprotein A
LLKLIAVEQRRFDGIEAHRRFVLRKILAALAALLMVCGAAQARSGRAAYHYHSKEMITAARYEPVGSVLKVTNPENGRSVVVRVAGRGPYNGNRILDLSTGAFSKLYGGTGRGVGPVRYEVLSRGTYLAARGGKTRAKSKKWRKKRATHHKRRR